MTLGLDAQVLADKALRDTTKQALNSNLAQVKLDLQARGLGGRIADEVVERSKLVFDEATEIAQEHPEVIGGTIAALALWVLRNPILGWLDELLGPRR